jgi:hypothetical protein
MVWLVRGIYIVYFMVQKHHCSYFIRIWIIQSAVRFDRRYEWTAEVYSLDLSIFNCSFCWQTSPSIFTLRFACFAGRFLRRLCDPSSYFTNQCYSDYTSMLLWLHFVVTQITNQCCERLQFNVTQITLRCYERLHFVVTQITNQCCERLQFNVARDYTSLLLRLH